MAYMYNVESPWSIFGRPLRPVSLGLFALMVILCITNIFGAGTLGVSIWSSVIAVVAGAAALLFVVSWLREDRRTREWAMLATFGLSIARSVFIILVYGWEGFSIANMWQSIAVAVIAGGSYLLEKGDRS